MAPEVVKQTGHSSKADIWSVGCLVVEMLTGSHPWPDLNQLQAMYQVSSFSYISFVLEAKFEIGKYAAPALPNDISPETAQFLNRTFDLDHSARPTAAELLQHPFCTDEPNDLEISQAAAQATMAAAAAARNPPAMQSLSALAEAR
jgi:mitogen-activated protein kinase kinase kinase